MVKLQVNPNRIYSYITKEEIKSLQAEIDICYHQLIAKKGKGNDFLGWLTLPTETLQSGIVGKIREEALKLKMISEIVVVVGIGGPIWGPGQ